ncbi:DUF2975 domain-containing protein [Psychroflexus sediminis]|uniref:DUF2975 domain-containing protein n=1 Tax=Psychroflexus sediminis TaxID=470826 RepID=A0A1G7X1L6_9FLAO|nr:DUF2975 domain-containing protein [Psychroflexus sediminis]SDG78037.1 Protein of unknown function [Psychroflexus sediminis]
MKTILQSLYLGVQFLRLVLSACIVTPLVLFITGAERIRESNLESVLFFLPVYIFWVFAFIALNRIVPVIKRCKQGDYFAKSNALSVRFLAYVLIIYAIGIPVLKFMLKAFEQNRLELSFVFDLEYAFVSHLALGLILLLLAKIIDRGRELEIDHKLTI